MRIYVLFKAKHPSASKTTHVAEEDAGRDLCVRKLVTVMGCLAQGSTAWNLCFLQCWWPRLASITAIWGLDLKKKKRKKEHISLSYRAKPRSTNALKRFFSQLNYMHLFFTVGVRIEKLTGSSGMVYANSTHDKGPLKYHSCLKPWWVCELPGLMFVRHTPTGTH